MALNLFLSLLQSLQPHAWARRKGIVADCARVRCQAVTVIAGAEFAGENQDQEDTGEEVGLLLITSAGLGSVQVSHEHSFSISGPP